MQQFVGSVERATDLQRADLDIHRLGGEIIRADLVRETNRLSRFETRSFPGGHASKNARDAQPRFDLLFGTDAGDECVAIRLQGAFERAALLVPESQIEMCSRRRDDAAMLGS